jgi:integrase
MARRQYKRLTVAEVEKLASRPGRHPDGDGLYLQVSESGAASWALRYLAGVTATGAKRERYLGLGPLRRVRLAEARKLAEAARRQLDSGVDPIDARHNDRLGRRVAVLKTMTFADCARAYIAAHAAEWKNPVHRRQWPATLETYVYPVFGELPVAAVDTGLVVKALQPIWNDKTETATRLRGRIEAVLGWAATAGHRAKGDNPASWKGHLENLLAKPAKAKAAARKGSGRGEHHAALPYREIGDFLAALRRQAGVAARALEFAILTASRTSEVIGARWAEIDLAAKLWTIPAERMKAEKEHRVPLSAAALAILDGLAETRSREFVFPGMIEGRPLGNMAMLMLLRRMGRQGLTVHGFRSSFSDWAAELPNFPAEVREMALAHAVGDKVEAAYRRGDLFAKRRQLAEAWARYCDRPAPSPEAAENIVVLRSQA